MCRLGGFLIYETKVAAQQMWITLNNDAAIYHVIIRSLNITAYELTVRQTVLAVNEKQTLILSLASQQVSHFRPPLVFRKGNMTAKGHTGYRTVDLNHPCGCGTVVNNNYLVSEPLNRRSL